MKSHLFLIIVVLIATFLSGCATDVAASPLFPGLHAVEVKDYEPEYSTSVERKDDGTVVQTKTPIKVCTKYGEKKPDGSVDCIETVLAGKMRTSKGYDTALGAAIVLGTENLHEAVHEQGRYGNSANVGKCSDSTDCAFLSATAAPGPQVLVPGTQPTGANAPADAKKVDDLAKKVDETGKAVQVFGEALDAHIEEEKK